MAPPPPNLYGDMNQQAYGLMKGQTDPYAYATWNSTPHGDYGSAAASIPHYAVGTYNVPQTGPAVLHQGEAVIPKPQAQQVRNQPGVPQQGPVLPHSFGPRPGTGGGGMPGGYGAGGHQPGGMRGGMGRPPGAGMGNPTAMSTQFSAANPPTLTPQQMAAKLAISNQIGASTMQSATNPNYAGAWEGANPNSPLGQQVNSALSAINQQRQAAANGGDWSAATWADLPPSLRPPGM
jgi:hypothetical protein